MFRVFRDEVTRLIDKAGIGGQWEITFSDKDDLGEAAARCTWNTPARWVRFSYNKKSEYAKKDVLRFARHEFGHFVIARMEYLATCRYLTEEEINEESEAIARVFERIA